MEENVQHLIQSYVKLVALSDASLGWNGDVTIDPVYMMLLNPDLKDKIRRRAMGEEEYNRLLHTMALAPPNPQDNQSKALARVGRDISPYVAGRLANMPPELLAVESGLTLATTNKYLEEGFSGQQIVDLGYSLHHLHTSSGIVRALIALGVDNWEEVLNIARTTHCPIHLIISLIRGTGRHDSDDLIGLLDECESAVTAYVDQYHTKWYWGWKNLLDIYKEAGKCDTTRTLDIFCHRYPDLDIDDGLNIDYFVETER